MAHNGTIYLAETPDNSQALTNNNNTKITDNKTTPHKVSSRILKSKNVPRKNPYSQ